ncbi:hypothetical protein KUTeg_024568 [Tegillarca granosa]|uniref:Cytoskeleton-associated protein 2 C-terminal domain-containing protein n=1 Tax=Tegillarca granosa TaxID=220873 RepID=A0ABQ9E2C7_TEGGR|nr:hypothetical protein KUTeg_024568 [Tegillarca granosa]
MVYLQGLPLEDTLKWLDSLENIPIAKQSARFYICKATVLQSINDLEKVLEVFETAVINNAKPSDELAKSLTAIIKEISEEREKQARQSKQLEKQVQKENIFESSSIKYCVRQVTPFSKR